jgi:hypothetical protein
MIGRGAIRNPWLFKQIRQLQRGESGPLPTGRDVLHYIETLYEAVCTPQARESSQVQKMKKYLNYIGIGIEPSGTFLHDIRRVTTRHDFFQVCQQHLCHDRPMPLIPFPQNSPSQAAVASEESPSRSKSPSPNPDGRQPATPLLTSLV